MNGALAVLTVVAGLPGYGWPHASDRSLAEAVSPPPGFRRAPAAPGSFAAWLRGLPVRPAGTPVRTFDVALKGNQAAHHAVLDIDVGRRDRQQCADAVMRLRAEYLFAAGRFDEICFRATSGSALPWSRWRSGQRPRVRGKRIDWKPGAAADVSWPSLRKYLDFVFTYAGSWSLHKELAPVDDLAGIEAGDVIIQGGFPGHAVMVADVAENARGERVFLLVQSYMPAQDVHVLRNPGSDQPWYPARPAPRLPTPEWLFQPVKPMRFSEAKRCR